MGGDAVKEAAEVGDDLVLVTGGWWERRDSRGGLIYHRERMCGGFHCIDGDCTEGLHLRHGHGHHLVHKDIHTPPPAGAVPCFTLLLGGRSSLLLVTPAKACVLAVFWGYFRAAGSAVLVNSVAGAGKVFGVTALERGFEGLWGAGDEGHFPRQRGIKTAKAARTAKQQEQQQQEQRQEGGGGV